MVRHSMSIDIEHQIFNGERMKTYTITTIVSYAQTNTVKASSEDAAKELSAELTLNNLSDATVEYDHDIESVSDPEWIV